MDQSKQKRPEHIVDILLVGHVQMKYHREKASWQRQGYIVEDRIAKHKVRLAAQFLEQERWLRKEDRAQQKDVFDRLLVLMTAKVQVPESFPWHHVLQNKHYLDY